MVMRRQRMQGGTPSLLSFLDHYLLSLVSKCITDEEDVTLK